MREAEEGTPEEEQYHHASYHSEDHHGQSEQTDSVLMARLAAQFEKNGG